MYVNAVSAFVVTFNVDDDGDEPNKSKNYVNPMLNESVRLEMNFKIFRSHPGGRKNCLWKSWAFRERGRMKMKIYVVFVQPETGKREVDKLVETACQDGSLWYSLLLLVFVVISTSSSSWLQCNFIKGLIDAFNFNVFIPCWPFSSLIADEVNLFAETCADLNNKQSYSTDCWLFISN